MCENGIIGFERAERMFLPVIMDMLQIDKIYGVVLEENIASHKVLEKNGFKLVFKGIDKYQGKDRKLRKYIFDRELFSCKIKVTE